MTWGDKLAGVLAWAGLLTFLALSVGALVARWPEVVAFGT